MPRASKVNTLPKAPSGIAGLDEVTRGGLPKGRPTLVCGGPGCGKSLFGIEFLIRGATHFGEPGVLMTFEETEEDIRKNIASLGYDLDQLIRQKKIVVDYVKVNREEIDENGEYDLEGLFIRLGFAIKSISAKRVMLDTIESLFAGLNNQAVLRAELRRLFGWLKQQGMTTVITGERGDGTLTRQGLEEYVSDCVILLDHRIHNNISTRRLRIVKYRGSTHGTNEYPFIIDETGISVLPITSVGLTHKASNVRVPSGIPRLDAMLGGKGFYRGGSILITGTAGTGKSSIAAHFAAATCDAGEKCLYFAFEESESQIVRNMSSIGLNLQKHIDSGKLLFVPGRPTQYGLETHLAIIFKKINEHKPAAVVIDPVSNFSNVGDSRDVNWMLTRLIDSMKLRQVTMMLTNLTGGDMVREMSDTGISSLMDTWILLRDIELGGERNRGIYVLKSRGMKHSNQIREFIVSENGIDIVDVYQGPEGVLTGSARQAQEAKESANLALRQQEIERMRTELARKREAMEAKITALRAEHEAEQARAMHEISVAQKREATLVEDRSAMQRRRDATTNGDQAAPRKRSKR